MVIDVLGVYVPGGQTTPYVWPQATQDKASTADVSVNRFAKEKNLFVHVLFITAFAMMLKKNHLGGQIKETLIVVVKYIVAVYME